MPTRHCSPTQDAQANRSIQAQRSAPTYLVYYMMNENKAINNCYKMSYVLSSLSPY